MDREFDQFLKELRPAAAHIPDAPNQTLLPCSGPRAYVGVFFDGTVQRFPARPGCRAIGPGRGLNQGATANTRPGRTLRSPAVLRRSRRKS